MQIVKKKLTTLDALGLLTWLQDENSFFTKNTLPITLMYNMEKNRKTLSEIRDSYEKVNKKIESDYVDDKHSDESQDEEGNKTRKVKDEYLQEFLSRKQDLLSTENEQEFYVFDLAAFGENAEINSKDMSMLTFFICGDPAEEISETDSKD